jgi:putative membrane protein
MHRKSVIAMAATIMMSGAWLGAQTPPRATSPGQGDSATKRADHAFVTEAAMGGMAEVDLGKLASEKATNDKVKAFGHRMATDHAKAGDELKSLAASKQITVPPSIDAKHQATHEKLRSPPAQGSTVPTLETWLLIIRRTWPL